MPIPEAENARSTQAKTSSDAPAEQMPCQAAEPGKEPDA